MRWKTVEVNNVQDTLVLGLLSHQLDKHQHPLRTWSCLALPKPSVVACEVLGFRLPTLQLPKGKQV